MNDKGSSHTQIPALDGLRALAVLAVIAFHLFPSSVPGGYIGVDLFFVISGFLITTLLIAEHARAGKINFKKFWLRRARRLLPALLVTVLVIGSIVFFVRGDYLVGIGRQILGAATFSSNWVEIVAGTDYFNSTTPDLFLNFWSLGVEEQFYLLWPLIALFIIAMIKRPRIGMTLTLLLALGSAGWMAYLHSKGATTTRLYYGTDTHLFGLMIGAFLGFWARAHAPAHALRRLFQPFGRLARARKVSAVIAIAAAGGWGWLACTMSDQGSFAYTGGLLMATLLSATLTVVAVGSRGVITKFFSLAPLEWVGRRSYGIYLWHWPLLVLLKLWLPHAAPNWLFALILVPSTFVIAAFSYRFIEVPVRKNGFRATLVKSFRRHHVSIDTVTTRMSRRPHIALIPLCLALILTVGAVITAPAKTSAQLSIENGQKALKHQPQTPVRPPPPASPSIKTVQPLPPTATNPQMPPHSIDGNSISAIGDSVMVASTPALQARFPGILINAEVSRSMRMGGLETIENMKQAGQLRPVVIVALGTNGYYGTDKLGQMVSELQGHKIILVTSHADREWTTANNNDIHTLAAGNPDISAAEWDAVITPHPEVLSSDGIHPINEGGDELYADAVASALKKFE